MQYKIDAKSVRLQTTKYKRERRHGQCRAARPDLGVGWVFLNEFSYWAKKKNSSPAGGRRR